MAVNPMSLNKAASGIVSSAISPTGMEKKNILNEITIKQQSLKRLSSDAKMPAEEKAKECREIQKQIGELNRKLSMLRMEKKEEVKKAEKEQERINIQNENQRKELSREDSKKGISAEDEELEKQREKISISSESIQKILEFGTVLQKERIQQSVSQKKKAAENILEAEIKSDELYGSDTSAKREKLSALIKEKPFNYRYRGKGAMGIFQGKSTG